MFWDIFTDLCVKNRKTPSGVCKELGLSNAATTKWKNGATPHDTTIKKIADYFDVSSSFLKSTVYMENCPTISRSESKTRIPVLGRVAAGIMLDAIDEVIDYQEIISKTDNSSDCFGFIIRGHNMEPRMVDGDIAIVKKQEYVNNGDIVVALINGTDAVCRKLKKTLSGIALISTNPIYDPLYFSNYEVMTLPVQILGKVIELRAKF